MASVAQAWPVIGPVAVGAEDWPELSAPADPSAPSTSTSTASDPTAAAAYTTIGWEVELWLKITDVGVLQLQTNQLETLDPYGGDPIKSFPEVICTHEGLFLLHLHTTHPNFPTEYFLYDCINLRGGHGRPRVYKLPMIKQPTHSRSMGLWRADDGAYVVANLRQELDREKKLPKTYLDCYYSTSNKDDDSPSENKDDGRRWITREVEFSGVNSSAEEMLFGWRTDLVIPFDDDKHKALLWVDSSRGILLCNDLLSSDDSDGKIELRFVPHPLDLFPEGDPRWEHPQPYCSVGCSDGKLKLVSLPSVRNNDACVVLTWTLDWAHHNWKEKKITGIDYKKLRSNSSKVPSHSSLPQLSKLAGNSPRYPILSTAKSNIYLTLVTESQAWLLRINMGACSLVGAVGYPSFFDHMNPPYPCYLSKDLNEDHKGSSSPTLKEKLGRQFKKFVKQRQGPSV